MTFVATNAHMPSRTLARVPWMETPGVRAVVWALGRDKVRFIGGCVRDFLCERESLDVDIATSHPPHQTLLLLEAARVRAKPIGIGHGTVVAITDTGRFEITSLRRDVETDGRHATVAFTDDWAEDAARRDFTINAMSVNPDGQLFDPAGGIDDLINGRVRFIGEPKQRIAEDVLRALRFFRFSAWYGTAAPDQAGVAACAAAASQLHILSGERVSTELRRLFAAPNPYQAAQSMADCKMLKSITSLQLMPRALSRLVAVEQANNIEPSPLCRLALALPGSDSDYEKLSERLKFSKAERNRLLKLARPLPDLGNDPTTVRQALYRVKDREIYTLQALVAAAEGDGVDLRLRLHEAASWAWPSLPVNGLDLIALGMQPGPNVGAVLSRLDEWWMRQDFVPDRESCLKAVRAAYERAV
jgi:poly(A) polymerase